MENPAPSTEQYPADMERQSVDTVSLAQPAGAVALLEAESINRDAAESFVTAHEIAGFPGWTELNEAAVTTTLPTEAFYRGTSAFGEGVGFSAQGLDELEPGEYTTVISAEQAFVHHIHAGDNGNRYVSMDRVDPKDQQGVPIPEADGPDNLLATSQFGGGSQMEVAAKQIGRVQDMPKSLATELMKRSGCYLEYRQIGGGKVSLATGTPETFRRMQELHDLPFEFVDSLHENKPSIPAEDYVGAFARGKFPIGTPDLEFFAHDTTDDHLPGVLLAGQKFLDVIAPIAQSALENGQASPASYDLDGLTTPLTQLALSSNDESYELNPDQLADLEQQVQALAYLARHSEYVPGTAARVILDRMVELSQDESIEAAPLLSKNLLQLGIDVADPESVKKFVNHQIHYGVYYFPASYFRDLLLVRKEYRKDLDDLPPL